MCVKLTEAALMQQRLNFIKGRIHSNADAEQLVPGRLSPAGEYLVQIKPRLKDEVQNIGNDLKIRDDKGDYL